MTAHDEVTNPNLHYGSRTLQDPEFADGAQTPEDGRAPSDDLNALEPADRPNGDGVDNGTPGIPADSDPFGVAPSASGAGPVDGPLQRSRTAGGVSQSIADERTDVSQSAPASPGEFASAASADDGGSGNPGGSGGGPGGGGTPNPPSGLGPTDIVTGGTDVDENAIQGTTVATLGTVDPEPGDTFTYALTNDPSGFFDIVGDEIQVAPGANIDYESDQSYDVTVEVTDASGNTYSEVITLTVNNLWDEGPTDIVFGGGSVDENAAAGTTVATLSTVDADVGDTHTYAITNDPSGFFEIVGDEVRVAAGAAIDFEADQSHDITVEVTDAGGNTHSEVITLTVNDLNDEAPTDITLTGGTVDENAAAGTTVATLGTVDADAGDSHTYAITNDASGFFEIVGNEVRLRPGALINFEAAASHDITIETTDAGGNVYSEVVTIDVNDINEAPTDILPNVLSVDENAAAGTIISALSATDEDLGETFTYQILNDPSGNFQVTTGKGAGNLAVAPGATLDFELADSHDILLQVTDSAGNTYQETVTINVNDVNEAPTDITYAGGSVDESAAAGTVVATLSADDPDAGDSHTYAITNDASGFFEIVGNEVRVAAGATIDFETATSHDITVETTDAAGNTYSEVITLTVNDLIDETPTDITLTGGSVDENAAQGTVVATLSTADPDAGDSHTYAITNDPSGFFELVGNEVRVAAGANIDFESNTSHDITVQTTDAAGNTYSEVVTLTVNDINEDPTDITLSGGSVDENAAAGTTVATLSTADPDAGDTHTYAIANDPSGFFEIVGNEVRVAAGANIDFETDQSHDITVETTDAAGNTYSEVVTLTVNDLIDETPTDITLTGGSVDENAAVGTTVATLSTVDADAGDSHT
ncbi:MAG: cadherin domain-containing protein, partial [Hyphomicrobiales bacterium]